MDPRERSKEFRDPRNYGNPFRPLDEPKPKALKRSYYHSPADQDFFYKAKAVGVKFIAISTTIGLYDAYMHKNIRTLGPMLAHASTFIMPGATAMGTFIGGNAVAVQVKGKDTPWCHFWGPFATVAFVSLYYNLSVIYPLGYIMGLFGVRYRFLKGREIEEGKPIYFKYDAVGDGLGTQPVRSMFSHLCRMDPVYSWPSETPDV